MYFQIVQENDWNAVRRNFQKIGSNLFGPQAKPTFDGFTLTGLTANSLVYPDSNKLLTSLGVASNGQLPIGSTGATPVLATLTGTDKRVIVTNAAGGITLSGPQDLDTVDSPTFAGGTVTGCATLGLNSAIFQPTTDSATFFQVKNEVGASVVNIDTINGVLNLRKDGDAKVVIQTSVSNNAILDLMEVGDSFGSADNFGFRISSDGGDNKLIIYSGVGAAVTNRFNIDRALGKIGINVVTPSTQLDIASPGTCLRAITSGVVSSPCFQVQTGVGTTSLNGRAFIVNGTGKSWASAVFYTNPTFGLGIGSGDATRDVFLGRLAANTFRISSDASTGAAHLVINGNLGVGGETSPETPIELTHATPTITSHCSTHIDDADARVSAYQAFGEQSGGEETTLGKWLFAHDGVGDTQNGYWKLYTNDGTDGDSPTLALTVDSAQNATFAGAINSNTLTIHPSGQTNDTDVSGVNTLFIAADGANAVLISGFTGGVAGQVLHVSIIDHTKDVTFQHAEGLSVQDIIMHDSSDETLDNFGGWPLTCDGTNWYDVSHAKHV